MAAFRQLLLLALAQCAHALLHGALARSPCRAVLAAAAPPAAPQPSEGERQRRRRAAEARQRRVDELECGPASGLRDRRGELNGLLSRGETYSVADYSAGHQAFKEAHNEVFALLAQRLGGPEARVFFLDGPDGGSTAALRARGFTTDQLYVANPHADTCAALTALGLTHVTQARAELALISPATASVPFCAAYLDGCGGQTAPLISMIEALFHSRRRLQLDAVCALAIGLTLTRAEPGGSSLGDRELQLTRALAAAARAAGFNSPVHVFDDPDAWGLPPVGKEHDATMTMWLVCERQQSGGVAAY